MAEIAIDVNRLVITERLPGPHPHSNAGENASRRDDRKRNATREVGERPLRGDPFIECNRGVPADGGWPSEGKREDLHLIQRLHLAAQTGVVACHWIFSGSAFSRFRYGYERSDVQALDPTPQKKSSRNQTP